MRALLTTLFFLAAMHEVHAAKFKAPFSVRGRLHARKALTAFDERQKLPNGLVYGESVRGLDLRGMTPEAIDAAMKERGFRKQITVIRAPRSNKPVIGPDGFTIPLIVYTHRDGGTVRVKPVGDPTNKLMPQPNAVKTLRWPYNAPGDGFRYEALKVDHDDRPLPRRRNELKVDMESARKLFVDKWANIAHADLGTETATTAQTETITTTTTTTITTVTRTTSGGGGEPDKK